MYMSYWLVRARLIALNCAIAFELRSSSPRAGCRLPKDKGFEIEGVSMGAQGLA